MYFSSCSKHDQPNKKQISTDTDSYFSRNVVLPVRCTFGAYIYKIHSKEIKETIIVIETCTQ